MSSCIKELIDLIHLKNAGGVNRFVQKLILTNKNRTGGPISFCNICLNKYMIENNKNRIQYDVNFRLIHNTRQRIHHALNGKLKTFSTEEVLGIDIITYRKYIDFQITPDMNWKNIDIDHVKPI